MRGKYGSFACFGIVVFVFAFVFFSIFMSAFVSADNLNLTLSTEVSEVKSDFIALTNANANTGYDSYDFDAQTLPSGYTRIYSTVSSKNLSVDSWNTTSLPRTINLTFNSDGVSGSNITYSWNNFTNAYNITLYDYGTNSTRKNTPNVTDMSSTSSYNASYSSGSRYLSITVSERAASVSGLDDTIYACEGSSLSHNFDVSVYQTRTFTLSVPASSLGASISTGSITGPTTQTVNLYRIGGTLAKSNVGSYTTSLSLIDNGVSVLTRNVNINVLEINHAPTITAVDKTAVSGQLFSYKVSASDEEDGSQDSGNLSFSLSSVGRIQSTVNISNSGVISFTPSASDEGIHTVTVCATDKGRSLSSDSINYCAQTTSPLTSCDSFILTIGHLCTGDSCGGSSTGGNSGGGGGGGGGSTTQGLNASFLLIANPSELIVNAVAGQDSSRDIKITNEGGETVSFSVESEGLPFMNIIEPDSITLNPGQSTSVKVTFSNYTLGLYVGKIVMKTSSGKVVNEIKTIVNVRTSNFLFDVRVDLPFGKGSLIPGENLIADINLDKIGVSNNVTNLSVYYVVKSFTGKTIYEQNEDLEVIKNRRYSKEIPVGNLPLGDYVFGIEVVYPGAFAAASTQFSIVQTKPYSWPIIIVGALIVIAFILALIARVRRRKIGIR